MPWKAGRSLLQARQEAVKLLQHCLNALESGPIIVTIICYLEKYSKKEVSMPWKAGRSLLLRLGNHRTMTNIHVSMPWKAGRSLLQLRDKIYLAGSCNCLNALESGPIIVTSITLERTGERNLRLSQCPGKRADHCYHKDCFHEEWFVTESQCPGKRADHCYV